MLSVVLERILGHPKTTLTGAALGAVFWYLLGSWHCQLPANAVDWIKWATIVGPTVLGMLAKD